MKLAFVYDAVYPWVKGGAEKRIYELGKRLAEEGHEVHVFGVKWWEGSEVIENDGMVLHGVCGPMELYVDGRRSISEAVVFSIWLFPYLFRGKFDVIDISAFPYFSCFSVKLVSVLRRTPMIITWHEVWGDYWYEYLGWQGFFGKIIEKIAAKLPDRHIAVSLHTKKELAALGVEGDKITVILNGIDFELIQKTKTTAQRRGVVFAGRLIKDKNVDILIEAIENVKKMLPDIQCQIIGNGPEKEKLVSRVNKLGLGENVKFLDFMDYKDFIARLKSAELLVLPSTREGFGIVLLEAMASQTPVIAVKSRRSAASEIVNRKNGILCSMDEIEKNILEVLTSEELRKSISSKCLEYSRKFDWNNIAKSVSRFYRQRYESIEEQMDRK